MCSNHNAINKNVPYTSLENLYGDDNVALNEFFPSNSYINYGYYEGEIDPQHTITIAERIASQAALYDYIFNIVNPTPSDTILEVGCGRGDGIIRLSENYKVNAVKGLDFLHQQISRAETKHQTVLAHNQHISFHEGSAENMPFAANSFSKIYSVEAAQHFQSLATFADECWRVLQPAGQVVVTTFFAPDRLAVQGLKMLMPKNIGTVDRVMPVEEVLKAFQSAGFHCTVSKEIGKNVFPYFDQWLSQQKLQDWARMWAKAWECGFLEYYVLSFEKKN
jgi:ubiquinone/menaquinone biosynthesis C-methylase UbiE